MSFRITALPKAGFEHLFSLPADELSVLHAVRMPVTKKPGFPCRVSLADAEVGEEVILVNYEHQSVETPYRSSHAIFVRREAVEAQFEVGQVPELFLSRTLSLRAFDRRGMMITADLAEGLALAEALQTMFKDPGVAYVHIHFAKPGCYAARADRA